MFWWGRQADPWNMGTQGGLSLLRGGTEGLSPWPYGVEPSLHLLRCGWRTPGAGRLQGGSSGGPVLAAAPPSCAPNARGFILTPCAQASALRGPNSPRWGVRVRVFTRMCVLVCVSARVTRCAYMSCALFPRPGSQGSS